MATPVTQRTEPTAIPDEEAILSEVLDHSIAIRGCLQAGLEPEHFYFAAHRKIFRAMRQLAGEGKRADEEATWQALRRMGLAAPAEDGVERSKLALLANKSTNPYGVGDRAQRIIEAASDRAKLEGARLVIESRYEDTYDRRDELLQQGISLIAADFEVEAQPTSPQELGEDFYNYLDEEEPAETFKLPWPELNECVLGGLRRQQTSVLGAWSGFGKSWVLDQMLTAFNQQGYKTAIFATEMSRRERVARYVTTQTGIPVEKLLLKKLSAEENAQALKAIGTIPYSYFESSGWSVERICERIVFGGYDIVAIDVINLIPGYEEKVEHASRIVARFMALAQRANIHVILVSHLNNERAKGAVKPRPVKRDLRQTGMLESNAHQILFLHREQDDNGHLLPAGELFYAKVRNGMEGDVKVEHNQTHLTFQRQAKSLPGYIGGGALA